MTCPCTQLDIASENGACLRLRNLHSGNKADLFVNGNGDLLLSPDNQIVSDRSFNIACHDGQTNGLKLNNELVQASAQQLNYLVTRTGESIPLKALVTSSNNDITGINLLSANAVTINGARFAEEAHYLSLSTPGVVQPSKAVVVDSNKSVIGLNILEASILKGTLQIAAQPNITSLGTLNSLDIAGSLNATITTPSQPNITSLGTLNQLSVLSGAANAVYIKSLNDTVYQTLDNNIYMLTIGIKGGTNDAILHFNGEDRLSISSNGNVRIGGTVTPYKLSVDGTFNAITYYQDRNMLNFEGLPYITNMTPGVAAHSRALILNTDSAINGISSLGTTKLILGGVSLTGVNANYISNLTIGVATAGKALVVNSNKSITGIESISASTITIGTPTIQPNAPLHVSTYISSSINGGLTYGQGTTSTYLTRLGSTSANIGAIIEYGLRVGSTGIFVASDRRLKTNIQPINNADALEFIFNTDPCIYQLKENTNTKQIGYIAQDLRRTELGTLVSYAFKEADLPAEADDDVDNMLLVAQYERICCILHKGLRVALERIANLEKRIMGD